MTKIQSDGEEIVDFIVNSQEILKSEEVDDHSGVHVQKARKIKYSPLKNPTSISDDIASLMSAKGPDDSEENKIENPALKKPTVSNFFFKSAVIFRKIILFPDMPQVLCKVNMSSNIFSMSRG